MLLDSIKPELSFGTDDEAMSYPGNNIDPRTKRYDMSNDPITYASDIIEIIDQKTNIALVTENLHPDLGVLKKAIESNEQRSVSILKPKEFIFQSIDFNLVILFSPNNRFNSVYEKILNQKLNTFTIAGSSTDWNFVNDSQSLFKQEVTNQSEDYQPELNPNFGVFIVDNITFITRTYL